MPWKTSSVLEERIKFVVLASRGERPITELCREFGISRQTGHMWKKRYEQGGASQLSDRSRRPHHSPQRTSGEIEQAIVELRERYPDWGAPKLSHVYAQQYPELAPVSERTVHRILKRHGLISETRSSPSVERFERAEPNELWQMDFKGPQGFNKGSPVGPLSILDDHSRYLLCLRHVGSTKAVGVRAALEATFEQVGLPDSMLVDHGVPWFSPSSPWGLTELRIWILRQGIRVVFSGLRHPQTQGKVERMHGALQRAIRKRKADPEDQSWLNAFRDEYNLLRPHAGIQMQTPGSRWRPSPRRYDPNPPEFAYPDSMLVARLAGDGQLGWRGRRWEISNALRRQTVGIELLADRAIVYFCRTPLRELDLKTGRSLPLRSRLPGTLPR
jgi:transposase InsO family protein